MEEVFLLPEPVFLIIIQGMIYFLPKMTKSSNHKAFQNLICGVKVEVFENIVLGL